MPTTLLNTKNWKRVLGWVEWSMIIQCIHRLLMSSMWIMKASTMNSDREIANPLHRNLDFKCILVPKFLVNWLLENTADIPVLRDLIDSSLLGYRMSWYILKTSEYTPHRAYSAHSTSLVVTEEGGDRCYLSLMGRLFQRGNHRSNKN